MAGRLPSVRVKNGRWYSEAGGVGRYFGRVEEVSKAMAMSLMFKALAGGESPTVDRMREGGEGLGVGVGAHGRKAIRTEGQKPPLPLTTL